MDGLSIFQESCRKTAVSYLKAAKSFLNNLVSGDPVEDTTTAEQIDSVIYSITRSIEKLEK